MPMPTLEISMVYRLALLTLLLAPCWTTTATAEEPVPEAWQALEMWEPQHIFRDRELLFVIAKERRVTDTIYSAMVRAGLCAYVGAGRIQLEGVEEIVILNDRGMTGWRFEGGAEACREVNAALTGSDGVNLELLGRTSLY